MLDAIPHGSGADREFELPDMPDALGALGRPLPLGRRARATTGLRRVAITLALLGVWQAYARFLDVPLLFPSFTDALSALWDAVAAGTLPARLLSSLEVLAAGYGCGVAAAIVFTTGAAVSRLGDDLLATLTAMFNPLPAIALLPIALIWFGLGTGSLVFVITHSVLWAVALNAMPASSACRAPSAWPRAMPACAASASSRRF